jgi:hypothetical protein
MNDANRNFYPSLESLYFPFGPQHCQRTWEFDTFTLETISDFGYEGMVMKKILKESS